MCIAELIDHLAERGVTFHPLDDGGLKVVGVHRLAPAERDTLKAHKAKLWAHLRRAANDTRLPTRADLAAALPAFPIEADVDGRVMVDTRAVLAHADEDDLPDLLRPDVLVAFGASLASDGKVGTWTETTVSERRHGPVRCIDCRHHRRTEHPHLLDCAAGVEPTNPTRLFWDTDRRGCEAFEPTNPPRNDEPIIEGELLTDEVDPEDQQAWRDWFSAQTAYSTAVPVNLPCACGGNMTLIDSPRPPMAAGKPELIRRADGRAEWSKAVDGDDIARQRAGLRYRCEACGTTIQHGQIGRGTGEAIP